MEFEYDGKVLKFDKELSDLDKLVLEFVNILDDANVRYVIISGYVAILLGRSRTTEDVDIFIDKIDLEVFGKLARQFLKNNYWYVDAESSEDAFDRLQKLLAIRVAKKDTVVPNFEVKFAKKKTDYISLDKPLKVVLNDHRLLISPLEVQLPFKIWLGTDKDIEDATHIYELFKDRLDKKMILEISKELKVEKEMAKYGII